MGNLILLLLGITSILLIVGFMRRKRAEWKLPEKPLPAKLRTILFEKIAYYNALDQSEKETFEYKVQEFLLNFRITGIDVTIDDTDRVLVAASAVIPIFKFKNWRYVNLIEVLLYPGAFNDRFQTDGPGRSIMGMVGTGYMEGKMILSKPALLQGFSNTSDKKNTAIHEFVHLIDMADGKIDGIPSLLLANQYAIPWINLIEKKIDEIYLDKSDINPYGGTNRTEFYAVISEYFFERPKLLKQKHPELYKILEDIFNQNMAERTLSSGLKKLGRNDPCPCNSGKKFKVCCGKEHF